LGRRERARGDACVRPFYAQCLLDQPWTFLRSRRGPAERAGDAAHWLALSGGRAQGGDKGGINNLALIRPTRRADIFLRTTKAKVRSPHPPKIPRLPPAPRSSLKKRLFSTTLGTFAVAPALCGLARVQPCRDKHVFTSAGKVRHVTCCRMP